MTRFSSVAGAAALFALLLSACSHVEYHYVPPATADGNRCIGKCATQRNACMANEQEASAYYMACERDAQAEYDSCVRLRDRNSCYKRECYDDGSSADCESRYRSCYARCGGRVEERVVR